MPNRIALDPPASESNISSTNEPDTIAPNTNAPETNAPGTNALETNAPDTNESSTKALSTNAPDTIASSTNAPETNAPSTNESNTNAPDTFVPVRRVSDHAAASTRTDPASAAECVPLLPSERVDDLLTHDLRIIQSDEVFAFSLDAVLLARFCTVPPRGRIIDLCSGNGVIPLLLTTRTAAQMRAVEIQPRLADMAARSVRLNRLHERIAVLRGDLRDLPRDIGFGGYDLVTVNPPYLPVPAGDQNVNEHFAAARHELHATLEDVVRAASRLAKSGGRVAMVHRPHRLVDICTLMRLYRIEPKRIRFVHPRAGDEANMVLVEGLRDGKPELRTLPPLIVYKNASEYTDELMEVFYGKAGELHD